MKTSDKACIGEYVDSEFDDSLTYDENTIREILYATMKMRKNGNPRERIEYCIQSGEESLFLLENVFGIDCSKLSEERMLEVAGCVSHLLCRKLTLVIE